MLNSVRKPPESGSIHTALSSVAEVVSPWLHPLTEIRVSAEWICEPLLTQRTREAQVTYTRVYRPLKQVALNKQEIRGLNPSVQAQCHVQNLLVPVHWHTASQEPFC